MKTETKANNNHKSNEMKTMQKVMKRIPREVNVQNTPGDDDEERWEDEARQTDIGTTRGNNRRCKIDRKYIHRISPKLY